jgi:hypothetical protein
MSGGNGNGAEGAARPTFDEALAAMPDRDRVDKLTIFAVKEMHELAKQSAATLGLIKALAEQIAHISAEVTLMRAEQRGRDGAEKGTLQ